MDNMEQPFGISTTEGMFGLIRGYISDEDAKILYEELKRDLKWQQPVIKAYGNTSTPKRKICQIHSAEVRAYRFPGSPSVREEWPDSLKELKREVEIIVGGKGLNHALVNHYLDGTSKLGYHADSLMDLAPGTLIVGIVLGSGRDFLLKKKGKGTRAKKAFIDVGDLFVMDQTLQRHYKHSVPERKNGSERLSITFRGMKPAKKLRAPV